MAEPAPRPASPAPTPTVRTNRLPTIGRLPQIGDDAEPEEPVEEETELALLEDDAATDPDADVPLPEDLPARLRNAVEFEAPEGAALLAVILVHEGEGIEIPEGLTLNFGVDASVRDASQAARTIRAVGAEVALIPSLPQGGQAQDVEVALSASLARVPEAVAILDSTGGDFQNDRVGLAQVLLAAGETGHGVITFPRGLNSAQRIAERQGIAAAQVDRMISPDMTDRFAIRRALDQAAFAARQEGRAILLAPARPFFIANLAAWAAEATGDGVVLAPLSAVLDPGE